MKTNPDENSLSIKELLRKVRQELVEAQRERESAGEEILFRVEQLTLEVNFVVSKSTDAKGGLEFKVLTIGGVNLGGDRSYQEQQDYEKAHTYLTDAVTLLQRLDDIFRLARAQTNLAAVLIELRRFADAGMLLKEAMRVQSRLGDKVGLSATRHNQSVLGSYIAR